MKKSSEWFLIGGLLISIICVSSCAANFLVIPINDLSDTILFRSKITDYNLIITYSSNLPKDFQTTFEPGLFGELPYDINKQVEIMFTEYFSFKTYNTSSKFANINVHIDSLIIECNTKGSIFGNYDIERLAILKLNIEILVDNESKINQLIITKGIINMKDPKYQTWMDVYSAAINKAINKSILITDNVIDSTLNQ